MEKKLFLIDAYALIFRSYYAFIKNPRINSKGLNTSAIFGFTNTLFDVILNQKPTHIAVAFDPSGPNFRHEMYPQYKANRDATPEDIKLAVPYIKELISACNIPVVVVDGFEADDVIGTLSKKAEKLGFKTFMMTPDKDYAQLVSENIFMFKPKRGGNESEIWGIREVNENFSIENPIQVIDLLGLMGDSSDNIPGAPGVGEKTAQKLLAEFGSIENLLQNTSQIKGKVKDIIEQNIDKVKISRELAVIRLDVPVEINESEYELKPFNQDKLKEIFAELEFRNLADRIQKFNISSNAVNSDKSIPKEEFKSVAAKPKSSMPLQSSLFDMFDEVAQNEGSYNANQSNIQNYTHNYILCDSPEKIANLKNELLKQKEICFDTETTGIDPNIAELVGVSFCFKKAEAYYIPFPANYNDCVKILEPFRDVFENPKISKIGQNIKFDMLMLKWYGIELQGKLFDTIIAHYLLQPDLRHNLNFLADTYLGYRMVPIEDLIGKGKSQVRMRFVNIETVKEYACEDADITFQLKSIFEAELKKQNLLELFETIEVPLIPVLAKMERTGVLVNKKELAESSKILKEDLLKLENEIYELSGCRFNIASPKQLGEVLFDKLSISTDAKKTKTKQYSTGEEILVKLKDKHPVINKVLEHRTLSKLLSTYVDALPELINPKTKRIHTSYNQTVASTGRLSSNNPNLQNIPVKGERGREIRKAFIPTDENHVYFSADYSQIELRIMADLSGDENMIEAFKNNEDIHTATASKIYKVPLSEVTRTMRGNAKTANFGIIYGISAFGLSERLNISRTDAKFLIDSYFESFPKVKSYIDNSIKLARDNGFVETIFHRKRQLADINSSNQFVRSFAERNAVNAPIQGSAADIIKIAMIKIHQRFEKEKLQSKMILQVHDELDFDVYIPELEMVKEIVMFEMQNAVNLTVPLTVECGVGGSWFEAH